MSKKIWKISGLTQVWILWLGSVLFYTCSLTLSLLIADEGGLFFILSICFIILATLTVLVFIAKKEEQSINRLLYLWGYTQEIEHGPWLLINEELSGVTIDNFLYLFDEPLPGYIFKRVRFKVATVNFYFSTKNTSAKDFCAIRDHLGVVTVYKRP